MSAVPSELNAEQQIRQQAMKDALQFFATHHSGTGQPEQVVTAANLFGSYVASGETPEVAS